MKRLSALMKRFTGFVSNTVQQLHRSQNGSISMTSVFFVIFFAMILGMVMNLSRHADRKIIMQNGADAATYSGGVVLSRSMNTLAFTNHLLCDVFAMTAYLREARDRSAESMALQALQAWDEMAPDFINAPVSKFSQLASAIPGQTALERNLVRLFGNQYAAVSDSLLPVLESILRREMIPEFQRALVLATPELARSAASEVAERHAPSTAGLANQQPMTCRLWRTDGEPFASPAEAYYSTLPVADPVFDQSAFHARYFDDAVEQRQDLSYFYLQVLNRERLQDIDRVAKMSRFGTFWRGFTNGHLEQLLEEYPDRNLPYQLRYSAEIVLNRNQYLHDEYMFVGVTTWLNMNERLPGLFRNPLDADNQAFAQIRLLIPRARLIRNPTRPIEYQIYRQRLSNSRDLLNQLWTVQIVPATSYSIPQILQTPDADSQAVVPDLSDLSVDQFHQLNTH